MQGASITVEHGLSELLQLRQYTLQEYTLCMQGIEYIGHELFGMIRSHYPKIWKSIENDIEKAGTVRHVSGEEKIYVAVKYLLRLKNNMELLVIHSQDTYRSLIKHLSLENNMVVTPPPPPLSNEKIVDLRALLSVLNKLVTGLITPYKRQNPSSYLI